MTELEVYQPPQPGDIGTWVNDFAALATIAGQLAPTAFVPASLRVIRNGRDIDTAATAAQFAAAVMTGRELGLEPMAALRSIDVIQGVPALRAVALRGILQAHGHELWIEESTNHRCAIAGQRKGSEHVQRLVWTLDDAKQRGLTGKSNWRSQPRNMLIARATGDMARLIAADALLGLPYTADELEDGDQDAQPTSIAPVPPPTGPRKAKRAVPRPAVNTTPDEPPLDDPPPAPPEPDQPPVEPDEPSLDDEPTLDLEPDPAEPDQAISDPQMRKMQALFHEQNFVDRDDRIAYVEQTIGRTVSSSSELSVGEASAVIDALQALPPAQ